jgi:hypothetical protein
MFRTLAAPGLEEDDLFAVRSRPAIGAFWGEGLPSTFPPGEVEPDDESERRRRHDEILRKWGPSGRSPTTE